MNAERVSFELLSMFVRCYRLRKACITYCIAFFNHTMASPADHRGLASRLDLSLSILGASIRVSVQGIRMVHRSKFPWAPFSPLARPANPAESRPDNLVPHSATQLAALVEWSWLLRLSQHTGLAGSGSLPRMYLAVRGW